MNPEDEIRRYKAEVSVRQDPGIFLITETHLKKCTLQGLGMLVSHLLTKGDRVTVTRTIEQ